VLANVELALTLSGVSRRERRKRAIQALDEVGLKDHIRKKPGQMSGGQMQRVAIARALINDPEILLADEPTGALDTTTSKQVMELLKEIAKDRLVIMVTHNNELAEKYANRIVHLTDGKVTSDTRPYDITADDQRVARKPRKASMSFWTAIMLSFSNLMTKKGRTITTAFAGSIGIIGIATILALSNGINEYIRNIEEETLSIYPLAIQDQGFDLSGFFGGNDDGNGGDRIHEPRPERPEGIREMRIMENVFATQSTNDLESLKAYFIENDQTLERYASTIHYMYDIVPQIFLADTSNGIDQINPDSIFSGMMGANDNMVGGGGMGFFPTMNVFSELPNNPALYESQYDVIAGRWPESYDEAVLVVSHSSRITDFALFSMGLRDRAEMRAMLEAVMNRNDLEIEISESQGVYTYDTFLDLYFKVIHPAYLFQFDYLFDVWVDKSGDTEFMEELLSNSMDLRIVGIAQPHQDASTTVLSMGINYTPMLITHLIEGAAQTRIVSEQLAHPEVNILSGRTFEEEQENPESQFDFSRIISVDEEVFRDVLELDSAISAFDFSEMDLGLDDIDFGDFDLGGINIDLGDIDIGGIDLVLPDLPPPQLDIGSLIEAIAAETGISSQDLMDAMSYVLGEFLTDLGPAGLIAILTGPDPQDALIAAFTQFINNNPQVIAQAMAMLNIDPDLLEGQIAAVVQAFMMEAMMSYMTAMVDAIQHQITGAIQGMTTQISQTMQKTLSQVSRQIERAMRNTTSQIEDSIMKAFEEMSEEIQSSMQVIDAEALEAAFQIELGEEEIFELMMSIMNPVETNFEQTLHLLGYADINVPAQILIYPRSFEAKQEILDILDNYNSQMESMGEPDRVIHFTDIVGLMMSTVTEIVDMVSYALVAFVSVALVVSSIMIGVITFISVLERKKEIGILRAVGASKGNIRLVFNAETLIIGFVAGIIGVVATSGIIIVANIILYNELGIEQLVILPLGVPPLLIGISMFLTYIAGLLPASAAASRAPVEALRSE